MKFSVFLVFLSISMNSYSKIDYTPLLTCALSLNGKTKSSNGAFLERSDDAEKNDLNQKEYVIRVPQVEDFYLYQANTAYLIPTPKRPMFQKINDRRNFFIETKIPFPTKRFKKKNMVSLTVEVDEKGVQNLTHTRHEELYEIGEKIRGVNPPYNDRKYLRDLRTKYYNDVKSEEYISRQPLNELKNHLSSKVKSIISEYESKVYEYNRFHEDLKQGRISQSPAQAKHSRLTITMPSPQEYLEALNICSAAGVEIPKTYREFFEKKIPPQIEQKKEVKKNKVKNG